MILFYPQATNRFMCIPREYVTSAVMILRDDSTNVKVKYALEPRVDGVGNILIENDTYIIYGFEYENLVEGHFYDLTLYSNYEEGIVILKDRAFCTAQKNSRTSRYFQTPPLINTERQHAFIKRVTDVAKKKGNRNLRV